MLLWFKNYYVSHKWFTRWQPTEGLPATFCHYCKKEKGPNKTKNARSELKTVYNYRSLFLSIPVCQMKSCGLV